MSDQPPPSFSGHPNYAQQWPPAYPTMLPPNYSIPPEPSAMNLQPPSTHGTPFDYNMANVNANSQIPSLGGPANSAVFFPPQFPFFNQFDASQFPPPFPPMPFPSTGHPPIPIPTGSSNATFPQQTSFPQHSQQSSTPAVRSKAIPIRAPSNREEGEVSEAADEKSLQPTRRATRQYSDLEEGETVSSSGRSSRRSSGSPYNPPLSISADPGIIDHAMAAQKHVPQVTASGAQPTKSVAQLRIQAQGALLSLAPHHIRYKELVAEGINPIILKRLYEEVGIKVVPNAEQVPSVHEKAPATDTLESSQPAGVAPLAKETPSAAKSNVSIPHTASPASSHSKDGKPLERKELIARMLAAKVAKAASKDSSPVRSANSAPTSDEVRPTKKEPKEKSKAQTELARQRIEELKRKALLKSQQKAQESLAPVPYEALAPAIHHPLPVRPPVPEPHHSAGLPGLFMTGLEQEPNVVLDPTPVSRRTHRKRPLASDFDEPVAPLKKHFHPTANRYSPADKLIIAISDDESLYGDDEDDNMELDSGSEQEPTTIVGSVIAKPPAQPYTPATRASTSTPQAPSSSNDQGEIRTKDMEIQAMRRKIAELELRRKSKLAASRTQSPRILDDSGTSSSSAQSSAADLGVADTSVAASSHLVPDAATSEEDSTAAVSMPPHDSILPVAAEALAEVHVNGGPHQKSLTDTMMNGTIENTARASASSESDSVGSAMDESDDSSSGSSDSSSEDEDEATSSPSQVDTHPPNVPDLSEPMDTDSSGQSVSASSPSVVTQPSANSVEGNDSQHHQSEQSRRESSVESEAYEPPEPDTEALSEGSSYSPPPFSPAPPDPVETTTVSAPSFDLAQTTEELTNAPQVSGPSSQTDLQVGALGTEASSANPAHKFTPYTSPLRTFKAYRYHPNYAADVPSGYRSLTYSHNIDSMKYFCPYEVAGGVCNDRSCEFQHLRDMTLSDDKILIQMGSAREGQTEEEKETYLAGLKEIINELRRDKVKDFNTVATEIAAYRRRFLQDPSRVLSL